MSNYFRNFPIQGYTFGSNLPAVAFQNLTAYVDVIDHLKDNTSFYGYYYIQEGDRADQVSQYLYGDMKYYWTFYLLNDHIREQGWPLSYTELVKLINKRHPNTVLETKDELTGIFKVGQTVRGSSSGTTGTILHRNLDLGQIVISGTHTFISNETVTSQVEDEVQSIQLISAVDEPNSTRYYIDGDSKHWDINPYDDRPTLYTPVTQYEYYAQQNDLLKTIKVLKRDQVESISREFQEVIRNV